MISQFYITILLIIGFSVILFISEFLFKIFTLNPEITRKLAHITATLASLIFVVTIKSHWYVFIICLLFFFVLIVSKYKSLLNSIDSVNRRTAGSYLLPVAIYCVFYLSKSYNNSLLFILPILILGISDPLAGLFGFFYQSKTKRISFRGYNFEKTYLGSSAFFISSLIITAITLFFYNFSFQNILILSILFAITNTLIEIISPYGTDNITIPVTTVMLLIEFI